MFLHACACVCVCTFLTTSWVFVTEFLHVHESFQPRAALSLPTFSINNKRVNAIPTNHHAAKSMCGFKSAVFYSVVTVGTWVSECMCSCMCLRVCVSGCELTPKAIMIESVGCYVAKHSNLMKKVKCCHFNLHSVYHVGKILVQVELD